MNELIIKRNYLKETLLLKKRLESSFLELAERLLKIREERLYEGEYENFAAFCWEARLAESTASRLISVFQKFCLEYKIKQEKLSTVGWSSLYTLLPLATSKERAEELVSEASVMTRDDVAKMVKEVKNGVNNCEHERTVLLRVCLDCGEKVKQY